MRAFVVDQLAEGVLEERTVEHALPDRERFARDMVRLVERYIREGMRWWDIRAVVRELAGQGDVR